MEVITFNRSVTRVSYINFYFLWNQKQLIQPTLVGLINIPRATVNYSERAEAGLGENETMSAISSKAGDDVVLDNCNIHLPYPQLPAREAAKSQDYIVISNRIHLLIVKLVKLAMFLASYKES